MRLKHKGLWVCYCAALAAFAVGCAGPSETDDGAGGGGGGGGDAAQTGTLQVLITDKPFPFEFIASAVVTITRVEVHIVGDADTNGVDDDEEDGDSDTNGVDDEEEDDDSGSNGLHEDNDGAEAEKRVHANELAEADGDDADTNGNDSDECEACDATTNGDNDDDADDEDDVGTNGDHDDCDECDVGTNGPDDEGPWITIFEGERSFDLLQLRNGRTDLLADAQLRAGTYNQMRLIVTGGQVTLTDGRVFDLRVPSGEQTGIKLHFTFEVLADQETTLLLDVDLSRAFKAVPGGHIETPDDVRDFTFSPSLGMRLIELVDAGDIAGTVTDVSSNALADVSVTAYAGESEISTTSTDANGVYLLGGLPTGDYRVEFSATGFADAEVTGVAVTAGQTTEGVDAVLTPDGG